MSDVRWPLMKNIITDSDKQALISHISNTDWLTSGPVLKEFERQWSDWLGVKHSLMVSSGSTANFLIVAAIIDHYKLSKGDKVIVPSTTWVTNVGPVMQLGLTPIFCDIDIATLALGAEKVRATIDSHPDVKVVFVTHLLGLAADIDKLRDEFPDVIFLEDVCESHGANIAGRKCGTFSEASSFSFYYGHHMTTIEGGMVCTDNDDLADLMRAKRSHGFLRETTDIDKDIYLKDYPDLDGAFTFITDGYNFRSTDINAVLGIEQLKRLDHNIEIRQENISRFLDILRNYQGFYKDFKVAGNSSFSLPFICDSPAQKLELETFLQDAGFETRGIISGNLLRQPFLKGYSDSPKVFEVSEMIHQTGFYIGNNHLVTREDFDYLESKLSEYFSKSK